MLNPSPRVSAFPKPTDPEELKTYNQLPLFIASRLPLTMRTYAFIYAGITIVLFCICPDYPQKLPEGAS